MIDLDRIEALANAATPGPWAPSEQTRGGPVTSAWVESLPADTIVVDSRGTAFAFGVNVCAVPPFDVDKAAADTAFIAAAREAVPALVAELRAARADAEALRESLQRAETLCREATAKADEWLGEANAARAEIERLTTAAADERADVVAWLRGMGRGFASHLASEVERGAHVGAAKGGEHG